MDQQIFAFFVPATMAVFAGAFFLVSRRSRVALYWGLGLSSSALGFLIPLSSWPAIAEALIAEALFLCAALAYGEALLVQMQQPPQLASRVGVAVLAYAGMAISIMRNDLQAELITADATWIVLLAWPAARCIGKARTAAHWALLSIIAVIILEAAVRLFAISWLVAAGTGTDAYFTTPYAILTQGTAGFFVAALGLIAFANIFQSTMESARQESERDPLTGLLNRRGLDRFASGLDLKRTEVSVIQCDLDAFKRINDTYGHTIGDKVLQRVAELLRDTVTGKAVVSRFGGEEFVILVPGMD
jgi:GGDEF domain-containing protein